MTRHSQNLAQKLIADPELGLRKLNQLNDEERAGLNLLTTVKKTLRLVPSKEFASEIGVSESLISQWINDSKPIPQARQIEILKVAKYFLMKQRSIEDHIDALMLMQFGKVED